MEDDTLIRDDDDYQVVVMKKALAMLGRLDEAIFESSGLKDETSEIRDIVESFLRRREITKVSI